MANLSLMALGSSTPEILLGIIEICGTGFYAGALGIQYIYAHCSRYTLYMYTAPGIPS